MVQCLEKVSKFPFVGMGYGVKKGLKFNMYQINLPEKKYKVDKE